MKKVKESIPTKIIDNITIKTDSIEEFSTTINKLNKKEKIVEWLSIVVDNPIDDFIERKVEILKQAFYRLKKIEMETSTKTFTEKREKTGNLQKEKDTTEEKLKELLIKFLKKKSLLTSEVEELKKQNLIDRKNIIKKIKELIVNQNKQGNFRKIFDEFKELQSRWKKIVRIPKNTENDVWKEYHNCCDQFYDLVKLNDIMRDYDFKKNLKLKQELCEIIERLDEESNIVSAFYQAQRFCHKWKEIGSVNFKYRKDIWERFKKAVSVINKKYQQHLKKLNESEEKKLEEKNVLCEEIENIDYSVLFSFKEWIEQTKHVTEIQNKWKTIGFIPKKHIRQLQTRFNLACNTFFHAKNNFLENSKTILIDNLKKKEALCVKAEALKNSTEWRETTNRLVSLQKEWKFIGSVDHKHSEIVWKRFVNACDYFFERKKTHFLFQKNKEVENLKIKKEIISNIQIIDISLPMDEILTKLHEYVVQFENTGFVAFNEKEKIHEEYHKVIDNFLECLKINISEKEFRLYESNLNAILLASNTRSSKNKFLNKRDELVKEYKKVETDIQTYENNIGFLSTSSKKGNFLIQEIQDKIDNLKSSLILIEKKIEVFNLKLKLIVKG